MTAAARVLTKCWYLAIGVDTRSAEMVSAFFLLTAGTLALIVRLAGFVSSQNPIPREVMGVIFLAAGVLQVAGLLRNCLMRRLGSVIAFSVWTYMLLEYGIANPQYLLALPGTLAMALSQGWVFWRLRYE